MDKQLTPTDMSILVIADAFRDRRFDKDGNEIDVNKLRMTFLRERLLGDDRTDQGTKLIDDSGLLQ